MANDDVFNLSSNEEASAFLQDKQKNDDGLLRPKLEEGRDGKRELVIRFLPNLTREGKISTTAIEKHIHYANFKQNPELTGYFDCLKNTNIGKDCPLCKTYWALKNSKNPVDEEKAKLISRSTKYYAYVYVVEDLQVPENEGKIFIFPFGYKIFQKIKMKAESNRKPVKVEDLIHGANLQLVIQEVAGFYNYDASEFETPEPITINGQQLVVDANGGISKAERARVIEFILSRDHDLSEFEPKDWTAEQHDKADRIISILSGQPYLGSSSIPEAKSQATLTSSSVFEEDEDEDEDEDIPVVKTKRAKVVKEEEEEDEPVSLVSSKKKAAAFFDDDDSE